MSSTGAADSAQHIRNRPKSSEESHLALTGTADAATIRRMRRELDAWMTSVASDALAENLVWVVYEALANCAEHAYAGDPDGPGIVRLTAQHNAVHTRVTVVDHGRWRRPRLMPFRGRGITLMRIIVPDLEILDTPAGTIVHLRVPTQP